MSKQSSNDFSGGAAAVDVEPVAIRNADSDQEIDRCFGVMHELRTHLVREQFVARIRNMEKQGFRLAYLEDGGEVAAVAGYRISANLFLGRHLYVDDLVTARSARSRGHGERLFDWLGEEARRAGCGFIHLDSDVSRGEAHRFYFRRGLTISSFHFRRKLDG